MKLLGMRELLLVGTGGFIGSVGRYVLSGLTYRVLPAAVMPVGTMFVNVLGCGVIGYLGGLMEARQAMGPELRIFLFLGVLGGFTTFSTFGYETLLLAREGDQFRAGANVLMTVVLCLVAVWLGHTFGGTR
jgi:CrcB protein